MEYKLRRAIGLFIGPNGCAGIYPAMLAIMAAPAAGIDPTSISFILTLFFVCIISSFGVAGVGGGQLRIVDCAFCYGFTRCNRRSNGNG